MKRKGNGVLLDGVMPPERPFSDDDCTSVVCTLVHGSTGEHESVNTQSADSTVSSFVDSSAQHKGMRPNLIAMKNKNSPSLI